MSIALITGAAIRIGRAMAEHMLDKGYQLLLHANTSDSELKSWVASHPHRDQVLKIITADLSTASGQNKLISEAQENCLELDLLVHNASDFKALSFANITRESYQKMMAINLDAPFFITQGMLPQLRKSKNPSVVNIIDATWERPRAKYSHYSVSKAGLAILTRSLAKELAPDIRVNGIAPGAMVWNVNHSDKDKANIIKRIPFKRIGNAKDIALALEFLADNAPYVTGEIICVDGGRSIE